MEVKCNLWCILIVLCCVGLAVGQEQSGCYGPGSIATSVIATFIVTVLILGAVCFWWSKYRTKKEQLILESDPEKGKGEYAFDNPGFKDTSLLPTAKALEDNNKSKWNQWSPLTALTHKSEKRKTMDDSALQGNEVKVIALRSHDFTGLGFNICGNMKEGIYIKDILHRGPAFESGKLNPGDRINSVTISFEHMVYEDALTILSYASPYEVIIEAKSGKLITSAPGQGGQPSHPVYRSSSCIDLFQMQKSSKKRLFGEDYNSSLSSNYSSLQKSRSNMTTLERKESKSPKPAQPRSKKVPPKHLSPEQLKTQLEQRIIADHQHNLKTKDKIQKTEAEPQKTENKYQRFGVRVLPAEQQQKSPKIKEQNENNVNIEKRLESVPVGIDEVDEMKKQPPPIKKREKKLEESPEKFERTSLSGSGIKRDQNGIPQELPTHMLNAAVAARKNRKSSDEKELDDDGKSLKKKGKAPSPPEEHKMDFDEIKPLELSDMTLDLNLDDIASNLKSSNEEIKHYNSDSDVEADNQSSVNTIELNSSDITIHQTEEEEIQNRKTVSTGDLTKLQKNREASTGTLERAQSLDISDSAMPTLNKKRKGGRPEDDFDLMKSEEDLFGQVILSKEPRLSLMLDGLNTFQRNRLKKSTEWGNLEDVILKTNQDDDNIVSIEDSSLKRPDAGEKSPEFDAVVNKIKEIKRESLPDAITENVKTEHVIKNEIWPSLDVTSTKQSSNGHAYIMKQGENNITQEIIQLERKIGYESKQEITIQQVKPAVPPPPIKVRPVNNRINEPFESNNDSTQSIAENKEMKPSIASKPAPTMQTYSSNSNVSDRVNSRQRVPEELTLVAPPIVEVKTELISKIDVLENNWKLPVTENIMNTSPPASLEVDDDLDLDVAVVPDKVDETVQKVSVRPEEVLSKIPLLNSMVKSQREESLKKPVLSTNNTDETKTVVTYNIRPTQPDLLDLTQNFLYTEQLNSSQDDYIYTFKPYDTNVSDDIKVSRHSQGSLERQTVPKSDDAKTEDNLRHISNVNVTTSVNGDTELHSLELSINDNSELYTTALETPIVENKEIKSDSKVTISTPDLIKNVTLAEAIKTLNSDDSYRDSKSLTVVDIPKDVVSVTENNFSTITESPNDNSDTSESSKGNLTLTYITEIQVTPQSQNSTKSNVSEIEIIPNLDAKSNGRNLDTEFENYVKNFESKLEQFESNIHDFDKNLEEFIKEEPKSIVVNEAVDAKELHKIHEIAEEQLKKLPEMRFTTSSYEAPSKIPEKRSSQIEMLRSNFEKSPPKSTKLEGAPKSRIPIAMTNKTPPTSPERRDSRNLENEQDKAILELMSSSVTSTPYTTSKYQMKPPHKNVTVTSIRTNSKIPSGLPTLSGRPPIAPRRVEVNDTNVNIQVSTNGTVESSFKQWVFNPSNVTNVTVTEHKQEK